MIKNLEDFLWGIAMSSYQIEGSPLRDGAGPSIWHRFSHTPGAIAQDDTGDIACDHYDLYKEDIQLMKSIGIKSYRFSISWPRVFPAGKGKINEKGIDFYDRLVDELLKADMVPFATLYHWDLPASLQDLGGWTNREIAYWFGDYADYIFQRLGDRVKNWSTLNEPWVIAFMGYMYGKHAPGIKDAFAAFTVVHNELRAHSTAVRAFREENIGGEIGITLSNQKHEPASNSREDLYATVIAHEISNYPLFLNPIFKGAYPEHIKYLLNTYMPKGYEKDLEAIKEPIDFVIIYYSKDVVKKDKNEALGFKSISRPLENRLISYHDFYGFLKKIQDSYDLKKMYFTISGFDYDTKDKKDEIHDEKRIDYLKMQTDLIIRAIKNGIKFERMFYLDIYG